MSASTTVVSARTVSMLVAQARTLLQDVAPTANDAYRYLDQDLIDNFNGAMVEARRSRPDLFLGSLRTALPLFTTADMGNPGADPAVPSTPFPLDEQYFMAFVYYVVGRAELREDTFSDNNRAVTLIGKFMAQLTSAQG